MGDLDFSESFSANVNQGFNQSFNANSLPFLEAMIKSQEEILPFDLLGRSLSYNPYPPRFREIFPTLSLSKSFETTPKKSLIDLKKSSKNTTKNDTKQMPKTLRVQAFSFIDLAHLQSQNAKIIILDIARDSRANPRAEGLECISYLRHYTDALIIVQDCFICLYQVLQSLVYGADALLFSHLSPKSKLKELIDFASHLGLVSLLESTSLREIKEGIFTKADGIFLPKDCIELVKYIPKRKIICTDAKVVAECKNQIDFVLENFAL